MTPGPWTFGYLRECPAVLGPDGEPVTTSMENARLIAAAPDLLEALQAMVDALNVQLEFIKVPSAKAQMALHNAHRALAKAEGRS
jgi:hypothetical protein